MSRLVFLPEVLRQGRHNVGLTQRELAARTGVRSVTRIPAWERGIEQPSAPYVPRLAGVLEIDPLTFYFIDKDAPPFSALRMAAGLTLKALSTASDVPYTTCYRIEHGQATPTGRALSRLARALRTTREETAAAIERESFERD